MKKAIVLGLVAVVGVGAVLFVRSETFLSRLSSGDDGPPANLSAQGLRSAFPGGSKYVLDESDQLFLYSLDGYRGGMQKTSFHGYPVVGRTEIKDQKVKAELVALFYKGMAANMAPASCFFPQHGLRAIKGEEELDLVLCFGCAGVKTYYGSREGFTTVDKTGLSFYNGILKKAGIPTGVFSAADD